MKIGDTIRQDGQTYRCVEYAPYISANGRGSIWLVLESRCAICQARFRYKTTRTAIGSDHFNRRCARHKMPGLPVARAQRLERRRIHDIAMKRARDELRRMQQCPWWE
jgi:hypothetical protein